ncbi:MAG: class I SAM-dependent methyltransferase [Verrucomicrobiota bacterium]
MALISFEQFMDHALHDPQHGYYARRIQAVGRGGDFTTAPMLSDAPARAIARWAAAALRETGCRNLIEMGPGEGTLAAAVLRHLPWQVRWRTQLHLMETSGPLRERQRKLLGKRALWHDSPQAALDACGGKAVIWSNELVDAFPVRLFQRTLSGWQEVGVETGGGAVRESLLPPAPLPQSSAFLDSHAPGQRVEVHESYHRALKEWMPHWKSGRLLTIDYGAESDVIYQRRPHGTLRAYLLHQRLDGPAIYQNSGRQDITADVNFTDLQEWSRPWVSAQSLITFGDFLHAHSGALPAGFAEKNGAGDAFLVLDQKR